MRHGKYDTYVRGPTYAKAVQLKQLLNLEIFLHQRGTIRETRKLIIWAYQI